MLSKTIERAVLREDFQLLSQERDRELSYVETNLPLEGPSRGGHLRLSPCLSSSEKKILETIELILMNTEKIAKKLLESQKYF